MTALRLPFVPLRDGYGFEALQAGLSQELRGGLSRSRLDMLSPVYRVEARWSLGSRDVDRFMALYRTVTADNNAEFTIDLVLDTAELRPYLARFVPGSVKVSDRAGTWSTVSAALVVRPADISAQADESLLGVYETYGDEGSTVLNLLAVLVNEDLP